MSEHTLESWRRDLLADGYAHRTVTARLDVVRMTARRAGVEPAGLQRQHIVTLLAAQTYKAWSRRTYLQHLAAWADWIGRPELVDGIRRPPVPFAHPDPVPEADLQRLMRHLSDHPRELAWVTLGAYAGLRAAEVGRLQGTHVNAGTLRVQGKGGRIDTLPVPPVLDRALRPWADVDGPLWSVTSGTVSTIIRRKAAEIGLRMRFHQLRHRFGTAVYRTTRDLLLTQRLMRHASPKTTAGYAALADEDARLAVDQIPGATPDTEPPKE
jgi:integrase